MKPELLMVFAEEALVEGEKFVFFPQIWSHFSIPWCGGQPRTAEQHLFIHHSSVLHIGALFHNSCLHKFKVTPTRNFFVHYRQDFSY